MNPAIGVFHGYNGFAGYGCGCTPVAGYGAIDPRMLPAQVNPASAPVINHAPPIVYEAVRREVNLSQANGVNPIDGTASGLSSIPTWAYALGALGLGVAVWKLYY